MPLLESVRRLDPNPSDSYLFDITIALTYRAMGCFEDAARQSQQTLARTEGHVGVLRLLIASQVELGQLDQARETAIRLLRFSPDFRISMLEQRLPHQPARIPRISAALRQAGLPE